MKLKPQHKILSAYLSLVLIGSLLLFLPFARHQNLGFTNTLFTAVSAVTITGLEPVSIANSFTIFGKIVIALLVQLGGLSITTLQVFLLMIIGAKISYHDRNLAKNNLNLGHNDGIVKTIKRVVFITLAVELIGIILFVPFFMVKGYGFFDALGHASFHTICSFNNAGFVILNENSLMLFSKDIYFNIVTMALVFLGGIGTLVIHDIFRRKKYKRKLKFHTKIVLQMSAILLLLSGALFFIIEKDSTILSSLFHAVTIRTAGFYTYNYLNAKTVTILLMIVFMFIGGAPASTAGGLKVTTIFTLYKAIEAEITNKTPLYQKRKIPDNYIAKAYLILVLGISLTTISTIIILIADNKDFLATIFEVFSAYSNTGLSLGLTSELSILSKYVLMILMLVGRIGIISFFSALFDIDKKYEHIRYIDIEYII